MLITNDHKNVNDEETRNKLKTKLIDNNNKKYRLIFEKTFISCQSFWECWQCDCDSHLSNVLNSSIFD